MEMATLTYPGRIATPSTGHVISLGTSTHTFKFDGTNTKGQFALMEAVMEPHSLTIPHFHAQEDELLIVQEGELGIRIGDDEFHLTPGSYAFAPRGTPHALWNRLDMPGKGLALFSPAGIENFFEEMGAVFAASNPPDISKLVAISKKYGVVSVMDWVPELCAKYGLHMR